MDNKFIIVEGQDNCGKSTLLRNLRSKITNPNIITLSSSGPPIGKDEDWNHIHYESVFIEMSKLVLDKGFDVLMDRFHIGETCYGPLFRNSNTDYIWNLEEEAIKTLNLDVFLIVLVDDGQAIINRDDGLSIENSAHEFDKIGKLFKDGYNKSKIKNKIIINISEDGWANVDEIYDWIYS